MLCTCRLAVRHLSARFASSGPRALRPKKGKSKTPEGPRGLVDMKIVTATGGRGGDGCASFLRVWANAEAGPDGGDGGNGGDVIFESCPNIKDLHHITTLLHAPDGTKGSNKDCHGGNARPLLVKVPLGTLVRNMDDENDIKLASDLEESGASFVAARGGRGGKGNHFFASATNQCPEVAELGEEGEHHKYVIEIRSMAHIGLIGFPNAGKSTLLQAVTRARPKVASYPFTTLQPYLGVVPFSDHQQVIIADLPGLIADAHKNRGLGHAFLRHATRCLALLFVLDLDQEWPQPLDELAVLRYELRQYSSALAAHRPWAIALNKLDMPQAQENLQYFTSELPSIMEEGEVNPSALVAISAKNGSGLDNLLTVLRKLYDDNVKDNEEDL